MDSPLPLSSLRLLVPPLRLMSAFMWQVAQQQSVKHYGNLEEFVQMVTDTVPELLSDRQSSLLLLALRAKMTLKLFGDELSANPKLIQTHLDRIQSVGLTMSNDMAIEESKANLIALTQRLLGDPVERERLLQEEFDPGFDGALQCLVCEFLSRLEELLPVPDFKQAASWLEAAPGGVEECVPPASHGEELRCLLQSRASCGAHLGKTVSSQAEDILLASLSRPSAARLTNASKPSDSDSESGALPEWVSCAHPYSVIELDETEAERGNEEDEMNDEEGRQEQEMLSAQQDDDEIAVETEGTVVIGQCQESANHGMSNRTPGKGSTSIPAVLSLITLNQTPIVFIPKPSPAVNSLFAPTLPLSVATSRQSGVDSPSKQSGNLPAKKPSTITVPTLKPHLPQPHTSLDSVCPESSSQPAVCHTEQSDTGDHSAESYQPSSVSPPPHNPRRVAHKCPKCGKCFIYRSQVIRHLRIHVPRGNPYNCSQCGMGFATHSSLNDHKRSVCVNATFDCPLCGKGFPSLREQYRHRLTHKANTCFQCAAGFKTKRELANHLQTHRAKPLHQCCLCGKRFRLLSSLTNHKQTHAADGGFACTKCERVFSLAKERDAHRQMHRVSKLLCPVCGEPFTSQAKLIKHQQTHPSPEGEGPRYKCRYCEETFTGLTQLRIHQRSHMEKTYKCDQCEKAFSTLGGLQSHRGSHSGDKPYLCTQCGKCFRTKDGLEGHIRIHTGERPFCCSYCGKRFTALAGLNVHVRRHTGERPYVCEVCGKGWPSGGDLQKHMRCHTGEKPYRCDQCGKTFAISCHLTEHIKSHSGEKPFSCPECGKSLKRKFDLKKHLLTHSGVRPYPCTHCEKSYTRRTHLNRHLQTHTTGNPNPNPNP